VDPFVAEIRIFPFNFAPKGWAFCDGQLLPISQNTALFSLLGTSYGGDGRVTFALPDFQGSSVVNSGQSSVGSDYFLGQTGGTESITLLDSEMPSHQHRLAVSNQQAVERQPPNQNFAIGAGVGMYANPASNQPMAFQMATPTGGGLPHNNMQPYLTLSYCIALQGVFPQRP
jgi:microcystin-dependent protein